MMHTEIYYSPDQAMDAALFICKHFNTTVSLKEGDNGEFIITWNDIPKPTIAKRKRTERQRR
jgi:hypothetical protein